jgi:hypothetical protein
MENDVTNGILVVAMVAILGAMCWIGGVEFCRYQIIMSTQPVDVLHDDLNQFVGKPVRMVLFTHAKPGVTASNGKEFAAEQILFMTRTEEHRVFLPEAGLMLTDHTGKLKVLCNQFNADFCTLIFKGRVTAGSNMLPTEWQDETKHNTLFIASALPVQTMVTAIGTLNKSGDNYELDSIEVPFNGSMIPIVSTLKTDMVLSIWMNQIIMPIVLKCGLCLIALLVIGLIFHSRQIHMGVREFR